MLTQKFLLTSRVGVATKQPLKTGISSHGIIACHVSPFENNILKYFLVMTTYHNL